MNENMEQLKDELFGLAAAEMGCDPENVDFRISLSENLSGDATPESIIQSMIAMMKGDHSDHLPEPKPLSPETILALYKIQRKRDKAELEAQSCFINTLYIQAVSNDVGIGLQVSLLAMLEDYKRTTSE